MPRQKITVTLDLDYGETVSISKNLEDVVVREVLVPLDFPSPNADVFGRMMCSPEAEIRRVLRARNDLAKGLAQAITESILDVMGAKDTEMGYPKDGR